MRTALVIITLLQYFKGLVQSSEVSEKETSEGNFAGAYLFFFLGGGDSFVQRFWL